MKKSVPELEMKKEVARDLIALGSIPFFILVLVRVFVIGNMTFFNQFLFSGIIFIVLALIFRASFYPGLALIVGYFTALNYQASSYTFIASIAYILLIGSLIYLKYDRKKVVYGVFLGVMATFVGNYLVGIV